MLIVFFTCFERAGALSTMQETRSISCQVCWSRPINMHCERRPERWCNKHGCLAIWSVLYSPPDFKISQHALPQCATVTQQFKASCSRKRPATTAWLSS